MSTKIDGEASSRIDDIPWLLWLEEEIKSAAEEGYTIEVYNILKDYLLSPSDTAADAALRVDTFYQETFLAGDPLLKFQDDKGLSGFLHDLWESFLDVVKRVSFDAPEQDRLVQLIHELHKLPPKPCIIWKEQCLVYTKEPIFFSKINANWNHNYVVDEPEDCTGPELKAYKEDCDQWVNFSAFLARCNVSRLDRSYGDPFPYPSRDLGIALEENNKPGLKRDYSILAASQYILLADRTLYEEYIGNAAEGSKMKSWGLKKWPIWTSKFAEVAAEYDKAGNILLATTTKKAHEKMSSYHV